MDSSRRWISVLLLVAAAIGIYTGLLMTYAGAGLWPALTDGTVSVVLFCGLAYLSWFAIGIVSSVQTRSLAPDLILLGGDLVTYGEGTNYDNMLSLCSQLSQIAPVCGVLGNHEDELYFLDGDRELVEKFTAAGVTILRNEEARYTVHDNVISILGVEGSPKDFYNYGASTFMDSVEPQTDYDLRICLAHIPTYFPEHLENYSFELGLAGHTHGGIVCLPKFGPLYSAEEGFLPDYAGCFYDKG